MKLRPSSVAAFLLLFSCARDVPETATAVTSTTAPVTATAPTATTATTTATETVACTPAAHRLCPVDEGPSDPSFAAYREAMRDAVNRNDEARLLTLVDPAVRTSFGGGGGLEDFRKQWKKANLTRILNLGGTFRDGSFWAPYIYSAWPDSFDAFQHVAAVRAKVPIRSEPAPEANVVAEVDWEILELIPDTTDGWAHVKTTAGQEGWVSDSDVRSPITYRAGFSKRSGEWKMEALVAGD